MPDVCKAEAEKFCLEYALDGETDKKFRTGKDAEESAGKMASWQDAPKASCNKSNLANVTEMFQIVDGTPWEKYKPHA